MRTIKNTDTVTIKVKKEELFEGKWLNFNLLSKKLADIEKNKEMSYKQLRNKFYNSKAGDKYNVKEIAGFTCINIDNPMKHTASLALFFERV